MKKIIFSLLLSVYYIICYANPVESNSNLLHSSFLQSTPYLPPILSFSNIQENESNIESVFRSFDPVRMRQIIDRKDEVGLRSLYSKYSLSILNYINHRYSVDLTVDLESSDTPEAGIVLGIFYYAMENNIDSIPQNMPESHIADGGGPGPFECFIGTIGSIIGLNDARSLYNDFTHGVSPRTILRSLRVMVRRVASVFTVISSVYYLGDCLDWW